MSRAGSLCRDPRGSHRGWAVLKIERGLHVKMLDSYLIVCFTQCILFFQNVCFLLPICLPCVICGMYEICCDTARGRHSRRLACLLGLFMFSRVACLLQLWIKTSELNNSMTWYDLGRGGSREKGKNWSSDSKRNIVMQHKLSWEALGSAISVSRSMNFGLYLEQPKVWQSLLLLLN